MLRINKIMVGTGITFALLFAGCESPSTDTPNYQFVESWGNTGSAPGELKSPIGIVMSGGELFVSEAENHRIQVFATDGRSLRLFGERGSEAGQMDRPMHMASAGDSIFVAEYLNDRIQVFSAKGEPLFSFGSTGKGSAEFDAPAGVAITVSGQIAVADFYNHRIQFFTSNGDYIYQLGTGVYGIEAGRFTYPTDVTAMPDGGILVGDAYNNRIQKYDATGLFEWMIPDTTTQATDLPGRFDVATGVAANSEGRIFVADFANNRIQVFSREGTFLTSFGREGSGPGEFDRPTDVAVDDSGNVYIVDFGNDRIQVFRDQVAPDDPYQ